MILLDTHTWLWWLSEPEKLSEEARGAIDSAVAEDGVHISAISAWEVAMLVAKGRLTLDRSPTALVRATAALPFVHFVDIDPRIAVDSVSVPYPDPADRIIAATATLLGFPLVTKDARLRDAEGLHTLW